MAPPRLVQALLFPAGLVAVGLVFLQNGLFGSSGDSYVQTVFGFIIVASSVIAAVMALHRSANPKSRDRQ